MGGAHDNEPVTKWANSMIHTEVGYHHALNLVDDLCMGLNCNKDDVIVKLTNDADFLRETKLVEIFASSAENIQIFFTDFFKINDTYNKPGTSGDANWSLRLPNNFKEIKPINMAKILKLAIEARGEKFAKENH